MGALTLPCPSVGVPCLTASIVCAFVIGLTSTEVVANGPTIGRDAGMVFPVDNSAVQLVSERVIAHLPTYAESFGRVSCRYELRNLSPSPQTFEMAFVTNPPFAVDKPSAYRSHYSDARFSVRQSGIDLSVAYEPVDISSWSTLIEGLPDSLPVWRVSIPSDTSTVLEMDYRIEWSGGGDGSSISQYFRYRARAASLWAGTIDRAEIVFEIDDETMQVIKEHGNADSCYVLTVTPEGAVWKGNRVSWLFEDWEPADDPWFYLRYCGQ